MWTSLCNTVGEMSKEKTCHSYPEAAWKIEENPSPSEWLLTVRGWVIVCRRTGGYLTAGWIRGWSFVNMCALTWWNSTGEPGNPGTTWEGGEVSLIWWVSGRSYCHKLLEDTGAAFAFLPNDLGKQDLNRQVPEEIPVHFTLGGGVLFAGILKRLSGAWWNCEEGNFLLPVGIQ